MSNNKKERRMSKQVNYYKELPDNAKQVKVIDAKDTKTVIVLYLVCFFLTALAIVGGLLLLSINHDLSVTFDQRTIPVLLIFLVVLIAYIVLHELVHGLFYKIMTHEKLTFGFTFTVAFCGVPKLYVTRKTALIAVLAPFVVFSALFLTLIL